MTKRANVQIIVLSGLMALGGGALLAQDGPRADRFAAMDTDGDGQITQAELDAHAAARFASADSDSDGFLTTDEMQAQREAIQGERVKKMLEQFDKDSSGALDASELATMGHKGRGGKNDRGARMMERMDADKDGKLSMEEMAARHDPARMLKRLDKDGNGSLSAEEFAQARAGRKGHGHHGMKQHERPASE